MKRLPPIRALGTEVFAGWGRHLDTQLAAALAFFSALALPPLMALTFAAAESIFGASAVQQVVYARVAETAGTSAAELLASAVSASRVSQAAGPAALVGLVGLLFAATGLVYQAQMALAHVFEWERGGGVKQTLLLRALGLGAIVVAAALTVALFATIAVLDALDVFARVNGLATGAAFAAVALAATLMSYHWLSGRRVPWDAAFVGAVIATLGVLLGRYGFQIYLRYARINSLYGSAGSIFGLLLWVYAVAMLYLVGAEVARAWMVVREGAST